MYTVTGRTHGLLRAAIPEHAKITCALVDYLRRINHIELNTLRRIITLQLDVRFMVFTRAFQFQVPRTDPRRRSVSSKTEARFSCQAHFLDRENERFELRERKGRASSLRVFPQYAAAWLVAWFMFN